MKLMEYNVGSKKKKKDMMKIILIKLILIKFGFKKANILFNS